MKHEAEIQQQAIAETPCTETAPCFACLRCTIRLLNLIPEAARKADAAIEAADGGGQWTPTTEKPDHYTFGPLSNERTITLTRPTSPPSPPASASSPAGTVLREAQADDGLCVRDGIILGATMTDPEPRTLGEQLHEEHDRTAHADGSPCLCESASAILADLTERVGLPREMAPSVEPAREVPPLPGPTPLDEAYRLGIHVGLEPLHEPERPKMSVGPNPILCDLAERITFERMSSQAFAAGGLEYGAVLATVGLEAEPLAEAFRLGMHVGLEPLHQPERDPLNPPEPWTCADDAKLARDIARAGKTRT